MNYFDNKRKKHQTMLRIIEHPLGVDEIIQAVFVSWEKIQNTNIGGYLIGRDFAPSPQLIGELLHVLIPIEISRLYPHLWRPGINKNEKDLVFIPDDTFSIEIKTSSSAKSIYANRSYAKIGDATKDRNSYFLAVNFEKITTSITDKANIRLIRFGYLHAEDWNAQDSQTGQQSRLTLEAYRDKLITLYSQA